jgi:hypothetical protein
LTYDGPGPFGSSRVAVRAVPLSVARIVSGAPGSESRLETQRILFAWLSSGGTCKASWRAQRIATILPFAPITCGIAWSAGWKPERAQVGSGPMVSAAEQLSSVAGAALVVEGALTLLADDSTGAGSWDEEHAATASPTSPRITQRDLMPRTVCPFITRRHTAAIRADDEGAEFRRWWQVLGSNQRRLCRRFYRPLPLATRATCLGPAPDAHRWRRLARIAQHPVRKK